MKRKLTYAFFAIGVLILSCKKQNLTTPSGGIDTPVTPVSQDSTIAPAGFDFKTTKTVTLNVNLAAGNNAPIAGVPVNVFAPGNDATPLFVAVTDSKGEIHGQVDVPAYLDTLVIDAKYVGLMRNAKALINGGSVNATIGGANGYAGNVVESTSALPEEKRMRSFNSFYSDASTGGTTYSYIGQYDNSGVPQYLVSPPDVITPELLSFVNASLPETIDVRKSHPQYLQSSAVADLNIVQTSDVWITFVSEGAGYLNTLGYYTYTTGNPPQSAADISNVTFIFPNASLPGSGGNLKSGSKVKLGRFTPGTSIGFVLLANAWNGGSKSVATNTPKFYSTVACNPETNPALKKHTVLLYSATQNLYLVGIDDQNRENGGSDNDFNDIVFYATSNPVTGISSTNVQPIDQPKDSDGDGVTDVFDQFPNDPTRAYINYYPSQSTFGTLAFEDLWPATGDYDMNDMVINYRYKTITNAQNQAVEMYADYAVQASGASYVSGFGVQFPFSPSQIKTVTGQKLVASYIKQNSNGTEAAQGKAVIIPFDSYQAVIKRPGGYYINTQIGAPYITGDTVHVYMSFTNPVSANSFGSAPFNPFLISNQRRGYEVHLPNNLPTDLADKKLFSTLQDKSNPSAGIYYKTKNSWPWALNFAGPFSYPVEGSAINKSYNHFLDWAKSGGTLYPNWYLDAVGNRNPSLIYSK